MNLNEYLFKTSQSLMKRVLMYINVDNCPKLLEIKNNENISFNIDNYEWSIISTLLLSSERYLDGINIEDYLSDEDIENIESLLSESDEILPGDDARQTQNCMLDNDNNTILTFDYLINGNIDDFSIDAFLSDLDGFGSYYEDETDILSKNEYISEDKKIVQELKDLRKQIIQKQDDANKANDLIVSNGKLNTRKFVEWLRNALAHSHYVPYNEKQLRFFIKGKSSNRFNAIIDKQIVAAIINMIYDSASLDFEKNEKNEFETLRIEIEEDLDDALYWFKEREQLLALFKKYHIEFKNSKNLAATSKNFINELPENEYYYSENDIIKIIDIINSILDDDSYTTEEKQEEIIDYLEEIKSRIEEDNVLNDAKFNWLYECANTDDFESKIADYIIYNTNSTNERIFNFINEEDFLRILKNARKNPDYNKKELFNKNKIKIILDIIERKITNTYELMKMLSNIGEMHTKLSSNRIDTATYKLLITALLKCNLLDGFNMNEDDKFENIDFSKFIIPKNIENELKAPIRNLRYEELIKCQTKLNKITKNIQKNEEKLANREVDNEYFLVILPQAIAKDKQEETDIRYEISELISDIDALDNDTFNRKILNQQIMRHLRNALAHGNVDIKFVEKDISTAVVVFKDIDENNNLTFQSSIKLIDLLEIISSDEFQQTVFNAQENTSKKAK